MFQLRLRSIFLALLLCSPLAVAAQDFGSSTPNGPRKSTFANLAAVTDGAVRYCTDCAATAPCTGSGAGAFAYRVGSAWNCNIGSPATSGSFLATDGSTTGATSFAQVFQNGITLGVASSISGFLQFFSAGSNRPLVIRVSTIGGGLGTRQVTLDVSAITGNPTWTYPNASVNFTPLATPSGSGNAVLNTSPTIVTPTIADFSNATHNHQNAAGGGTLTDAAIVFTAPALGTPASGVMTNVTGTAAGLTAGAATNTTNTAITDDTSTNATVFPTWVTTASGNQAQKTSSTLLTFNPSSGNLGVGVSPSSTTGIRLLAELDGNQITKIQSQNATAGTAAGGSVVATSDVSTAQFTAFSSLYSGTLAGINLAGSSSVNNAGLGTVGFTVGSTSAAPVILMTNATRGLTVNASSQAVSLRGTQTNDNATTGDTGEFTTAVCPGPTTTATITVTIASPAVVTWTSHPFSGTAPRFDACPVVFTTSGALPTGITSGTNYWVVPGSVSGNTFSIATSVANAIAATKVNTSGTQSGTQTGTAGTVLSTGATKDVTGLALTAGDWDCSGATDFQFGSTTSYTNLTGSISATAATLGGQDTDFDYETPAAVPTAGADMTWSLPTVRQLVSSTTNVFAVAQATFTLSTLKTYGTIRCRRMR